MNDVCLKKNLARFISANVGGACLIINQFLADRLGSFFSVLTSWRRLKFSKWLEFSHFVRHGDACRLSVQQDKNKRKSQRRYHLVSCATMIGFRQVPGHYNVIVC